MLTADEIEGQRQLLDIYRRNLARLLHQAAQYGGESFAPLATTNGIDAARADIARIKAALRVAGIAVADHPDDQLFVAAIAADDHVDAGARSTTPNPLVADLPRDSIPAIAALPPGSRMPFRHNPLFVGRAEELKMLARSLLFGSTATAAIAATGLGGIGKSNLATEFVHRYDQFFPGGVFWLSFADPANVLAEIATCGGPAGLDLPSFDGLTQLEQAARVRREWQRSIVRLLVFDNCEDERVLAEQLPITGAARVLVTSRRTAWDAALEVVTLHLQVLPHQESIALLRRFRPDLAADDAELSTIAAELGDLPLALHLAGSFLKQYRADVDPAAYLAELRTTSIDHESLQGLDLVYSPTNHALDVGRTFKLSYDQLRPDVAADALALALLARAACLAPGEPIPRDLLLATLESADTASRRAGRAITQLIDLGLLDTEQTGVLIIHRLVAAFAQRQTQDAAALDSVEQVLSDRVFDLLGQGVLAPLAALVPHLRFLAEQAVADARPRAARLCRAMARYLRLAGNYWQALPYAQRALAIDQAAPDVDQPTIASDLNDVASVLQDQGDYAAARPLFERALAIAEASQGLTHPTTGTRLNNLAMLLQDQGDYAAARPLFERALAIAEASQGPTHPTTGTRLNNLAGLLKDQDDYAAARPLFERALQICILRLGRIIRKQLPSAAT